MKYIMFNPIKSFCAILMLAGSLLLFSCEGNTSSADQNNTDSVYSGLEGTREEASQLSNATIDTSSGQTVKTIDSSDQKKDSVPIK